MNEAEYLTKNYGIIEEGVMIASSEISIILLMIRKPNTIIVLLFIQNNSYFKNIARSSSIVHV